MKLNRILVWLVLAITLGVSRTAWCGPHLDLEVGIDPATRTLVATVSIKTEASELSFYLAENMILESAEVDGATIPTDHNDLGTLQRFRIDLADAAQPQTVRVRYHGTLQALDTSMTHDDTLDALPAMSSPEGSYLPGSSSWYPVLESAFTYHLKTVVPEGHVAVAPGAPSDESLANGVRRASFAMSTPVNSIDMMVGPWSIGERIIEVGEARIALRTYFGESAARFTDSYLDAAERFIKRYSQEIGPYPYTVFSVVASPIPTGFGMPTLTYLGEQVLGFPFIRDISLGHEVLHNWWGNGVRVDPVRGNWAEGLTTFMADYAYREDESALAALRMRHGWLRDYAALSPDSEQPLSAFRARHHTASAAIGYGKAAMLFYDLRSRLGAETFAKGLRTFWNEHRAMAASFDDLRVAFEQAAGHSLEEFFNQWLDRTGAPQISVKQARLKVSGKRVEVNIELLQGTEPFDLSVPLQLFTEKGKVAVRVPLSSSPQRFRLPVDAPASAVQVDPRFEVWRRLTPEEAPPILRDLIAAQTVQVVALKRSLQQSATTMAQAFSEGDVQTLKSVKLADPKTPLIVAGSKNAIAVFLEQSSMAARSKQVTAGVVEVWIVPDRDRKTIVVAIETPAGNEHDWSKLGQRLRHFGRYSWVSIAKDGETARGNWDIESPLVRIAE